MTTKLVIVLIANLLHLCLAKGGGGGSSGGGFSGGGFSGGGYYAGGRRQGGGEPMDDKDIAIMFIFIIGVPLVVCLLLLLCVMVGYSSSSTFETEISKAEKGIVEDSKSINHSSKSNENLSSILRRTHGTFRGSYYDSSYNSGNVLQESSGTMVFIFLPSVDGDKKDALNCCSFTGAGTDSDGTFQIKRGRVSVHTGKSCWVESGQRTETLLTGHFSPVAAETGSDALSFRGTWKANNGASGKFNTFDLVMDSTPSTQTGNGPATTNHSAVPLEDTTLPSIFRAPREEAPSSTVSSSEPTCSYKSIDTSDTILPSIFRATE